MSNAFMNELPPYYVDIREFQELSETVVVDWDKLDEALFGLEGVEDDQFILTSSEAAIAVREKDFGIVADPKKENLKFRKLRILARMQENAPYVLEYLIKVLNRLLGENNHQIFLDIALYEMEVAIETEQAHYFDEVERIAERIVPLNIAIFIKIKLTINESIGATLIAGEIGTVYPYISEVPIKLDVSQTLAIIAHSSGEIVKIYPKTI